MNNMDYRLHNYEDELLRQVDPADLEIYQQYLDRGLTMECKQSNDDLEMYLSYVKMSQGL
jgi:hypothetical protein